LVIRIGTAKMGLLTVRKDVMEVQVTKGYDSVFGDRRERGRIIHHREQKAGQRPHQRNGGCRTPCGDLQRSRINRYLKSWGAAKK